MPLSPINSKPNDETQAGKIFAEIRGLDGQDRLKGPLGQFSATQARQLKDYIDANLDCTLKLVDLANLVQLSPRHFMRIFSNTFGTTPHRYIMSARVTHATELISNGRLLSEIAADLGFASQSHFCVVFHKIIGMSPGRFRQRHQSQIG